MASFDIIKDRASALLDKLANDPDRPYWEIELVRITMEALVIASAAQQQNKLNKNSYAELLTRVERLETRYSELLYKLSEIKSGSM